MRHLFLTATAIAALGALAPGQTTGVPFLNDYTVAGAASGSTSCTVVPIPGGGPTVFTVTCSPTAVLAVLVFSPCPCAPGFLCVAPTPCAIPATACPLAAGGPGTTNQSLDLLLPCGLLPPLVVFPVAGVATAVLPLPPGLVFGTQAAVVDPACPAPLGAMLTQAYTVTT